VDGRPLVDPRLCLATEPVSISQVATAESAVLWKPLSKRPVVVQLVKLLKEGLSEASESSRLVGGRGIIILRIPTIMFCARLEVLCFVQNQSSMSGWVQHEEVVSLILLGSPLETCSRLRCLRSGYNSSERRGEEIQRLVAICRITRP
jgi:hypothetical protein